MPPLTSSIIYPTDFDTPVQREMPVPRQTRAAALSSAGFNTEPPYAMEALEIWAQFPAERLNRADYVQEAVRKHMNEGLSAHDAEQWYLYAFKNTYDHPNLQLRPQQSIDDIVTALITHTDRVAKVMTQTSAPHKLAVKSLERKREVRRLWNNAQDIRDTVDVLIHWLEHSYGRELNE